MGHVTSGAYGFTLGGGVGLAWVHGPDGVDDAWLDSGEWRIDIRDHQVPASVHARAFYDPSGARAR